VEPVPEPAPNPAAFHPRARPNRGCFPSAWNPKPSSEDLSREVSVDVKLSIDKHGSVKNAQVLNGGTSQLATLAANNAETTSWEPAKQGDRTVSSDVTVHYRFRPAP
jgi:TonB-like protein